MSVTSWCVSVGALVPLLAHVVMASSCAASSPCLAHPGHYHEDAAALPWASLLLCAAGVTNPLLYVFTDDQASVYTLICDACLCMKSFKNFESLHKMLIYAIFWHKLHTTHLTLLYV